MVEYYNLKLKSHEEVIQDLRGQMKVKDGMISEKDRQLGAANKEYRKHRGVLIEENSKAENKMREL